ncbi:MAG: invasion associated locus B family protein [Pseudomonadota bacterium]
MSTDFPKADFPKTRSRTNGKPAWVADEAKHRRALSGERASWKAPILIGGIGLAALVLVAAPLVWFGGGEADAQSQLTYGVSTSVADEALDRAPIEIAQAQAQAQTPAAQSAQPAWRLRCTDTNVASTCNANQELFLNRNVDGEQRNVGRLLNITVLYLDAQGERLPFMSLQMPLGLDLRPGAVMQVDDGQEMALEFLRCTNDGCDASVRLTPDLLGAMRAGNTLRVGFRPWGSEQVTAVEASLIGFTAAFLQLR